MKLIAEPVIVEVEAQSSGAGQWELSLIHI